MAEIPTIEPASIAAGDTLRFDRELRDYPASAGWQLSYTLINATGKITFSAAAVGDTHAVTVAASITAQWAAGDYAWRARVSKAGEVYTVGEGRMAVRAAWAGSSHDARSHARRTLDAIEAMLEGRASNAAMEYEIAGRRLRYIPVPELLQLRGHYRAEVAREEAAAGVAAGLPDRRRVFVRFA